MPGRAKPVRRSDGREFASICDAAKTTLVEKYGTDAGWHGGRESISRCLTGNKGFRKWEGFMWEPAEATPTRAELIEQNRNHREAERRMARRIGELESLVRDMWALITAVPLTKADVGDITERVGKLLREG